MDRLPDLKELHWPEHLDHERAVIEQISALETEYRGVPLPDEARPDYMALKSRQKELEPIIAELRGREQYALALARRQGEGNGNRESAADIFESRDARGSTREIDIYDLSTIRGNLLNPSEYAGELRDRAMRAVESATFPMGDQDKHREHLERLLQLDEAGALSGPAGVLAARILSTGGPTYRRAFPKALNNRESLTSAERAAVERAKTVERAISLTEVGYAVPFQIDPTVIPISNGVLNPLRRISRIVQITQNTWKAVTSAGITAAYGAQGATASDNSPTLANPDFDCDKAFAFVPFNIEAEDWGGLQAAMAQDFADAKDTLEATQFLTGVGHASNAPEGLLTGGTAVVDTAASAVFAAGDLFSLTEALPERWQPRASVIASRPVWNDVRQFGTATGYAYLTDLVGDVPATLLGYPRYTLSTMNGTSTGTGNKIMTVGDFNMFAIVDRIGLNVEVVPHLFGTSMYPTGQRGLYMYWRNTSGVLAWQAFRTLRVKAT